jgi:hypothetical protein
MGAISSPKLFKRTKDKWTSKFLRTSKGFKIHEAPRPNENSWFSGRTPNKKSDSKVKLKHDGRT